MTEEKIQFIGLKKFYPMDKLLEDIKDALVNERTIVVGAEKSVAEIEVSIVAKEEN